MANELKLFAVRNCPNNSISLNFLTKFFLQIAKTEPFQTKTPNLSSLITIVLYILASKLKLPTIYLDLRVHSKARKFLVANLITTRRKLSTK